MSEKKPEKGMSRRSFLGRGAAAAGAAATGGISGATSASSIIKAGAKALPSFKVIESLISTLRNMEDLIGKITNVGIGDLQSALRGELTLPRYPAKNEYWDTIEKDRIDFSSQRKLLKALKKLPADQPINELLSDTVLKESSGKDGEAFDQDPVVLKALALRKIIGPMCNLQTTSADLIEGMKGYFVKLGQHAIHHPDDFVIQPVSDYPSWGELELKDVIVHEVRTHWDDYGSGRYESVVGRNDISDLVDVLESYEKSDKSLSPIISQLKEVNAAWELKAKEEHVRSENDRVAKIRAEQKAEEDAKKDGESAKRRLEEETAKHERKERLKNEKAEPDKRSGVSVTIKHKSGDQYTVNSDKRTTQVDYYQWAQSIDPNLLPHHISFEASTNTLTIKNDRETAPILRELFRNSNNERSYTLKLPNRRSGIDLRHEPDYLEKPLSSQFKTSQESLNLKIKTKTVSASEIFAGHEILGVDFSRKSKFGITDQLTAVNNIPGMVEKLKSKGRAIGGYRNEDDQVTIVHFDIEKFKTVNDLYGHGQGDIALQEIAYRISDIADYETVIGRVSGDKFMMIYYDDRRSEEDLLSDVSNKLGKSAPIIITDPQGQNKSIAVTACHQKSANIYSFANNANNRACGLIPKVA